MLRDNTPQMSGTNRKRGRFILDKEEKRKKRKLKHEAAKEIKQSLSKEEYLTSEARQAALQKQAIKKKWKHTDKNDIPFNKPHIIFDLRFSAQLKQKVLIVTLKSLVGKQKYSNATSAHVLCTEST